MHRIVIRVLQIAQKDFILNNYGLWIIYNVSTYQIFDSRFSREMRARYFPLWQAPVVNQGFPL